MSSHRRRPAPALRQTGRGRAPPRLARRRQRRCQGPRPLPYARRRPRHHTPSTRELSTRRSRSPAGLSGPAVARAVAGMHDVARDPPRQGGRPLGWILSPIPSAAPLSPWRTRERVGGEPPRGRHGAIRQRPFLRRRAPRAANDAGRLALASACRIAATCREFRCLTHHATVILCGCSPRRCWLPDRPERRTQAAPPASRHILCRWSRLFVLATLLPTSTAPNSPASCRSIVSGTFPRCRRDPNWKGERVEGLTTAAGVWMTAAIGMARAWAGVVRWNDSGVAG